MKELDAYLRRIALGARPSVAELHRAHVSSIPFENLDPRRGVEVSLEPAALEAKLVDARRGGYCFEQNLLLLEALAEMGVHAEPILGRVRNGKALPTPPQTHLLIRAEYEGAVWHLDAGFGLGTLIEPIPFGPGGPYEQAGWYYRVISEGPELVLQTETSSGWFDLYSFRPEPAPWADIELGNWWVSTHPQSPFVTGLIVTEHASDGTRTTLSDWSGELTLTVQTPAGSKREPVAREAVPELLESRFRLAI